ncbi:hypothetical protein QVN85_11710 [Oscillibacter valericigenes]|nr:hypothetical protein [Oscillibacter valericigenes]
MDVLCFWSLGFRSLRAGRLWAAGCVATGDKRKEHGNCKQCADKLLHTNLQNRISQADNGYVFILACVCELSIVDKFLIIHQLCFVHNIKFLAKGQENSEKQGHFGISGICRDWSTEYCMSQTSPFGAMNLWLQQHCIGAGLTQERQSNLD